MDFLKSFDRVLVIAAHPDDEVLGAGGVMAKFSELGKEVHLVHVASGKGGRFFEGENSDLISAQQKVLASEITSACEVLGVSSYVGLSFPDNRLDTVSRMDVSLKLKELGQAIKPDLVLSHHYGDYNWDHSLVLDSTMMAFRSCYGEHSPKAILSYEVLSSTERSFQAPQTMFSPSIYIDISKQVKKKIKALECYKSELHSFPHTRSSKGVEILSQHRGMEVGIDYAEAFQLIRLVGD